MFQRICHPAWIYFWRGHRMLAHSSQYCLVSILKNRIMSMSFALPTSINSRYQLYQLPTPTLLKKWKADLTSHSSGLWSGFGCQRKVLKSWSWDKHLGERFSRCNIYFFACKLCGHAPWNEWLTALNNNYLSVTADSINRGFQRIPNLKGNTLFHYAWITQQQNLWLVPGFIPLFIKPESEKLYPTVVCDLKG